MFNRKIKASVMSALERKKSVMLLGPRQTGKTTIAKQIPYDRYVNLMDLETYYRYSQAPYILAQEIRMLKKDLGKKPLVVIDEIQKIPELTNALQVLIDEEEAVLLITGSSARKIKNLLPGRVILFRLSTMMYEEYGQERALQEILMNGLLPRICQETDQNIIDQELYSYVSLYLEEEIRKEALVRNLGQFVNFLRLACIESGKIVNFSAISQEIGVSQKTIVEYYRILEDCLLVRRIDPLFSSASRRRLTKSSQYIVFDLGLRRAGAREGIGQSTERLGQLLEQYVGLEIMTQIESLQHRAKLFFWRDHNGPEVDYVLEIDGKYIPIEVKSTKNPSSKDIKHLKTFREEYPIQDNCYLVADVKYRYEIEEGIVVLPWFLLNSLFS